MRLWAVAFLGCLSAASADVYLLAAGVEQYDDPTISSLHFAVADAVALTEAFARAGVPADRRRTLRSDAADRRLLPTRGNLMLGLQWLRGAVRADDTVIVFFAGHGLQDGETPCLLTMDTIRDDLAGTALPLPTLLRSVSSLAAGRVLVLLDACRNDPRAGRGDVDGQLSDVWARNLRPARTGDGPAGGRPIVLLACDVGQRAWEMPGGEHGVFTHYLLEGLAGAAADDQRRVFVKPLADYVQREVADWATRNNTTQTPRLDNPDDRDFELLDGTAAPVAPSPSASRPAAGRCEEVRTGAAVARHAADAEVVSLWARCGKADLSSEQVAALDAWVRAGHRLVLESDLAEEFGFSLSTLHAQLGPLPFQAALPAGSHPLLDGLEAVRFQGVKPSMRAERAWLVRSHPEAVPLLVDGYSGELAALARAAHGAGELLWVTTLPLEDDADGRRLQRNLQLYVTRPPVAAGRPVPLDAPARSRLGHVWSSAAVAGLAAEAAYATLFLECRADCLDSEAREALMRWVDQGGRLVVYDDAATWFGFRLADYPGNGRPFIATGAATHPLVESVRQVVGDLNVGRLVSSPVARRWDLQVTTGHPAGSGLLCDEQTARLFLLAVAPHGQGEVVFYTFGSHPNPLRDGFDKDRLMRNMQAYWTTAVAPRP